MTSIAHFLGEGEVVDGKGVVGLDGLHVGDFQACVGEGHFSGRDRRCGHEHRLHPRKAVGDDLYFDLGIRAQFFGLVPRGNDDAAVAVGRERLGAEAEDAARPHRFQLGQALGRGRGPALVLFHQLGLLLAHGDLRREHVALLECPVIGACHLILLIAPQDHRVALLLGDAHFLGHVLGGLHHGDTMAGASAEVVHVPVFPVRLASRTQGVGPYGVGPVGTAVGSSGRKPLRRRLALNSWRQG